MTHIVSGLAPIAKAVGALMVRLKSALDAERSFAARSAHELRTPIAGPLAQTQQQTAELGNARGAARPAKIEAALKRLATLSEKLPQWTRIEARFTRFDLKTDMMPVMGMVIGELNASSPWRDRVQIESMTAELMAVIVRNASSVVGAAELARMGHPFVRGTTTADGSGLGLSIARSILEQAGGALKFKSAATDTSDGFEATIVLPKGRS